MSTTEGAWHPDPQGRHELRWYDGRAWTDQVSDGGVVSSDPLDAPPFAAATPGASAPGGHAPVFTAVPGDPVAPAGTTPTSKGRRFGSIFVEALLAIVTLGIGYLIWMLIVWSKGQTPGKQVMGIRVVDTQTGQAATWGKMFLREFVIKGIIGNITFGLFTLIGGIMLLSNDSNLSIWDKMAGTLVVDDPNKVLER